jgi:serine/threonine-protein kinase
MSPEQARGGAVDHRSDIYSLAAVLYRMLTGVPPFVGSTSNDTMIKICTEPIPKPSDIAADLPLALDAFFDQALARRPEERFESVADLVQALDPITLDAHPERSSLPSWATAPIIGRSSATESVRAPVIDPKKRASHRQRGFLALAAISLLLIGISFWPEERQSVEPEAPVTDPARDSAAANAADTATFIEPPREHDVSQAIRPDTAAAEPAPQASGESARESAAEPEAPAARQATPPQKAAPSIRRRKAEPVQAEHSVAPAIDPVFGLPLPAAHSDQR